MDTEDYVNLAVSLRNRGKVVRQRNHRGKAKEELLELAQMVSGLSDEQIALVVYTMAVTEV